MSLVNYNQCPICNGEKIITFKKLKDHSVSKKYFIVSECSSCHFLFTNPVPDEKSIGEFYKSDTYISHTNKANNPVNFLYKIARKFTLQQKVNLIKKYGGNKLLDVGCGTGLFLEEAYKKGFDIKGIETDRTARENISKLIDNQVVDSIESLSDDVQYDLITLWHVLEHIHNLGDSFKHLIEKLKDSGYIFIAVPNHESWDAKYYKDYWAAWDVPRHLYHFNKDNLNHLFKKHNIFLKEILPMKLDSLYVSILSEKYKGQPVINQLLKGFINGIKSNFKAKNKNYSSIIYIGQKNVQ